MTCIIYCDRLGKMPRGPRVQRERAMPSLCGDGAPSAQGRTPWWKMWEMNRTLKGSPMILWCSRIFQGLLGDFRWLSRIHDFQGFSTMFLSSFGSRYEFCGFAVSCPGLPNKVPVHPTVEKHSAFLWQNDLLSHQWEFQGPRMEVLYHIMRPCFGDPLT